MKYANWRYSWYFKVPPLWDVPQSVVVGAFFSIALPKYIDIHSNVCSILHNISFSWFIFPFFWLCGFHKNADKLTSKPLKDCYTFGPKRIWSPDVWSLTIGLQLIVPPPIQSPWTNGPQKVDPHGQRVPNQFGTPGQMVLRIFRLSMETGCGDLEIRGPNWFGTICLGRPNFGGPSERKSNQSKNFWKLTLCLERGFGKTFVNRHELEPIEPHDFRPLAYKGRTLGDWISKIPLENDT